MKMYAKVYVVISKVQVAGHIVLTMTALVLLHKTSPSLVEPKIQEATPWSRRTPRLARLPPPRAMQDISAAAGPCEPGARWHDAERQCLVHGPVWRVSSSTGSRFGNPRCPPCAWSPTYSKPSSRRVFRNQDEWESGYILYMYMHIGGGGSLRRWLKIDFCDPGLLCPDPDYIFSHLDWSSYFLKYSPFL